MITVQKNRLEKSFKSEQSRLLAFVRSKIHSLEESEDLLQDVFLQALTHLNVLEAVDNMTAWLYTVTKNKIIDWYRKRGKPTLSIQSLKVDLKKKMKNSPRHDFHLSKVAATIQWIRAEKSRIVHKKLVCVVIFFLACSKYYVYYFLNNTHRFKE